MSDPFFGPPSIDTDEWRDRPYRHRYVHGGFDGTDTRFAFRFPEPSAYAGRFAQFLQGGMGGSEHQGELVGAPRVAAENGAYYLESNQGHVGNDLSGLKGDQTILAWRASAQSARYARQLAAEMYGEPPHHGYVFGGSGGAMRAVECLEREPEIWDGAVPFMINRNGLLHFNWSLAAWAGSVLRDEIPAIVDAVDAGGGGDPFAALHSDAERQALAALYRGGYCRGAESQLEPNPLWILGMQLQHASDPAYFSEFWSERGYEGAEGDPLVRELLIEEQGKVERVLTARELLANAGEGGLESINAAVLGRTPSDVRAGLDVGVEGDPARFLGSTLRIASGRAAGRRVLCSGALGGSLVAVLDPEGFRDVEPGDAVEIDNRDLVAFAFYHRHLVDERYPAMRQLFLDGRPLYRQRPRDFDRIPVPSGRFRGKMILIQHGADRECWPNCAEPYIEDVRRNLGDRVDASFRIWWIENAAHLVPLTPSGRTRLINYTGCYAQAVRDLIAWVEDDAAPPRSTRYALEDTGYLRLASTAAERGGIQPVVRASANGGACARVRVGEEVRFEAEAQAPPGAGAIVLAEWDFDGSGAWPQPDAGADGTRSTLRTRASHAYAAPGTYFATCRVGLQREGQLSRPLRLVTNLARARVVVS